MPNFLIQRRGEQGYNIRRTCLSLKYIYTDLPGLFCSWSRSNPNVCLQWNGVVVEVYSHNTAALPPAAKSQRWGSDLERKQVWTRRRTGGWAPYLHSMALLYSHFSPVWLHSIVEYNVLKVGFQGHNSVWGSLCPIFICTLLPSCAHGPQHLMWWRPVHTARGRADCRPPSGESQFPFSGAEDRRTKVNGYSCLMAGDSPQGWENGPSGARRTGMWE